MKKHIETAVVAWGVAVVIGYWVAVMALAAGQAQHALEALRIAITGC